MKSRVVRGSQKPIFRWAGSKRKLLPTLRQYTPPFVRYVEPFAGSACLFFDLLPPRALLGDVNHELIETYTAVRIVGRLPVRTPRGTLNFPERLVLYTPLKQNLFKYTKRAALRPRTSRLDLSLEARNRRPSIPASRPPTVPLAVATNRGF